MGKNNSDKIEKLLKEITKIVENGKSDLNIDEKLPSEEKVAETVRESNKQFGGLFDDDFIGKVLDRIIEIDKEMQEKFGTDETISFVDKITREGNLQNSEPIPHEIIHDINIEKSFLTDSYSEDFERYNEEVKCFKDYLALTKEIGTAAYIHITRRGNTINYGRLSQGLPIDNYRIDMISDDNLKELYESIKIDFAPEFSPGSKHAMIGGWSLLPTIGDSIMLEIISDKQSDRNWIYDEIHNRPPRIIDEPIKK